MDDSQLTAAARREKERDEEKGKAREDIFKNVFVHTMNVNAIQNNIGAH